uniref:Putative glycosyltransferase n=1 Tax=viral metagenome TaxID=1070528 RepID=A0A6M3MDY3_9ZZZZ
MNILLVSHYDNGGQLQQLSNALNKYTNHDAIHLNYKSSFLDYDVDINASDYRNEELKKLISDKDFFIFSEFVPPKFKNLGIEITRKNTIFRCFGTATREKLTEYRTFWKDNFITFASGGFDNTIHPYLGFCAYHIPNLYDFSVFPKPNRNKPIRICQAPTKLEKKSTREVVDTLKRLEADFGIEPVIIHGRSWKETLEIKTKCHITIDQFKFGPYASSAIESMYLGHTVVSRLSPFVRSMHPDIPIVQAELNTLYDVIKGLLFDSNSIDVIGEKGHEYTKREHEAKTNIAKWDYLIQWVTGGFQ